jgi:UDP-3-O-[3-hydroxymyristoyl] glucosamine N-acyltransferase
MLRKIMVILKDIIQEHSEFFKLLHGDLNSPLNGVSPPDLAEKGHLCFISSSKQWESAQNSKSIHWIVLEKFLETVSKDLWPNAVNLLTCKNISVAMALLLPWFDDKKKFLPYPLGISAHAFVHPTAEVGQNVTIAPYSLIGPGSKIGNNTIIGPHCTIEGQVSIGDNSWIESHVFLASRTQLGCHCHIKPFASIGSDGYGFAPTQGQILKIPQIGRVIIGDHVQIGANTCIDRATLTETRIGNGTKIDNLVHIAHNCKIGNYCMITAAFAMAGSSVIDDYFVCGGCVAVGDHVHISKNVTLAGASVVTGNIEEAGSYGGNPIQPMQDYLKTRATLIHLHKLRKQLSKVVKYLGFD